MAVTYSKIKEYVADYLGIEMQDTKPRKRTRKGKKLSQRELGFRILLISVIFIGVIGIIGLVGFGAMVVVYSKQLPPPGKPFQNVSQNTNVYDRNGVLLASLYGNVDRKWVSLSGVNSNMQHAMLAAEDINFYNEPGIDIPNIIRAALYDVINHGSSLQGASTITQQLAKNAALDNSSRTIQRKVEELILTFEIEKQYTKNQILEAYLNEIPFGGEISGVAVASETYFNKEPSQVDLAQAAFLAGLPNAPSYYSPVYGEDPVESNGQLASTNRAYYVLDEMLKHKDVTGVTQSQVNAAKAEILTFKFNQATNNYKAPGFVQYIKTKLEEDYGTQAVQQGGLQVYTTLDYSMQQVAEDDVNHMYCELNSGKSTQFRIYENGSVTTNTDSTCAGLSKMWPYRDFGGDDAGMVSIDPKTGEIMAMVGSPTGGPQYNIVTLPNGIQPGSSIKPMLYLSAFKNLGFAPTTLVPDVPIQVSSYNGYQFNPPYAPTNFGGAVYGVNSGGSPTNIDFDLSLSLNVPAVETLYSLGLKNFTSDLTSLGYSNVSDAANTSNLSYAIGGENVVFLQHVDAYAALANEGTLYPATSILKITDSNGKVLYQYDPTTSGKRVIDPAYPYLVDKMLEHYKYLLSVGHAFNPGLFKEGYDLAGKTGTNNTTTGNQNASSITFVGYTPDLVSGFWFGNQQQGTPMNTGPSGVPEGEYLIPYWGDYMQKVLTKFAKDSFQRPSDVVEAKICSDTGMLNQDGKANCPTATAEFEKDHLPPVDNLHSQVEVCASDNNSLATPDMISTGEAVSKVFTTYKASDPAFQGAVDAYVQQKLGYPNKAPTGYCTGTQGLSVSINTPKDQSSITAGENVSVDTFAAEIGSSNTVTGVTMSFNGNNVGSLSQGTGNGEYTGSFVVPSNLGNGTYPLVITATDSSGATQSATSNLVIGSNSNSSPGSGNSTLGQRNTSIVFTYPFPTQSFKQGDQAQFKITPFGMSGISAVKFYVYSNNTLLGSVNGTQNSSVSSEWDSSNYTFPSPVNGSGYTIDAVVTSGGNNYYNYIVVGSKS